MQKSERAKNERIFDFIGLFDDWEKKKKIKINFDLLQVFSQNRDYWTGLVAQCGGDAEDIVIELDCIDVRVVVAEDVGRVQIEIGDRRIGCANVSVERFVSSSTGIAPLVIVRTGCTGDEMAEGVADTEATTGPGGRLTFNGNIEIPEEADE